MENRVSHAGTHFVLVANETVTKLAPNCIILVENETPWEGLICNRTSDL